MGWGWARIGLGAEARGWVVGLRLGLAGVSVGGWENDCDGRFAEGLYMFRGKSVRVFYLRKVRPVHVLVQG